MRRFPLLAAVALLFAVSAFADQSPQWRTASDIAEGTRGSIVGTVVDVNEGANRLTVQTDDDRYGQVNVMADAVSTQYNGFGGVINGKPEIFLGSRGFANVRVGDRIEVRGMGAGNGAISAEAVTLLGRQVAAGTVGVGDTRTPTNISTPTSMPPSGSSDVTVYGRLEGTVRQVNATESRIVIETPRREMITVRGSRATPVYYRGQTYQIVNLEPGDRVRVEQTTAGTSTGSSTTGTEVTARSIEVVQSVQDSGGTPRSVTQISGRVTRVAATTDMIYVDTGRGDETRVDVANTNDSAGRRIRAADVRVGDTITATGSFGNNSSVFTASTLRFGDEGTGGGYDTAAPAPPVRINDNTRYTLGVVTIFGTVADTLANGPQIVVRESQTGTIYRINATDDFIVRTKGGTHTTADRLKVGDNVVVKAYRDADGNYIAQTIRGR
jgi:hypothetical protein